MAKKKNREFDTSPMALGRQQKNSAAQKADQKRSASSNGKNNPRVAKNNTQSTAPIAYRSEQATKRAGRNQERLANQRRVQSGGTAQQMREQKTNLGQKPKQMSFTEKQEQAQQKVAERKAGKKETGNRFLANEKQVGVNKENRFADITAGTLKQIGGGHLTSLGHDSNDYNEFKKNLEQQVIDGKISESTMNKNLEAYKRANTKANRDQDWQDSKLHKTFQKIEQKGQELNAKGDAQVEKAKEGLGTGGKLLADAYSSTLGMASDMMLGPAWAASMMSRSYGNTLNSTRELVDKGIITEKEAENNAGLQAIKEAATEYMFAGAGIAKGLKGVGKATEAFEGQLAKGIDKLAARIPEGILRNAGYSTLKSLGGIAEESTEELAGGILDPILTNLAYGNKAYERTEGAQVRSNLQMNSMSLQDQLNALVAQGYDREEMLNMYASEIGSEEYKAETIADLMNSGYSEKEANKLAAQMQNYMLASLSGDEKALKKAEDSVVKEFGKYSDIRSSFSWSETGEAMASAAIMVAATGAPGMATRNQQGAAIKKAYEAVQGGRNAASNISWSALTLDDEKMASRAQAMYEQAQKGEDLANEQYAELHQALMKQRDINIKNAESSYETARKMADKDRLFARGGTNGVDENNNVIYTGAVTQRAATTLRGEISVQLAQAEEAFGQMDDAEKHDTIEGITSVLLGQATPDSVESLTTNHPIARSIYESITGEKLPASNEATRNALFEASANNYVEMARAETVEAIDVGKGGIDENYMNQFGSEGQDVYKKLSDGKSVEDSTAYVDYVSTISKVYDAGAKGLSEKAAIELAATQGISEADAKELYEAGKSDATTSAGGRVTTSFKNGGNLRNSAREVYMAIAKMFNVNIELTDDISVEVEVDAKKSKDKTDESEDGENKQNKEKVIRQANGQYDAKTNTLTLNLNEDITKNIGYTVMHELTHKIKTNNLAGYKAFARMFEERWIEKNGQESFDKAIQDKIDAYEKAGITFTKGKEKEDALEEIICDQMGELLHDRAFISRFAAEETDGAVSVLSAIRDIIRKITQLFAVHGGFRSDYNEALLSELGLLREAEMFFANSIQAARSQQTQEMLEKQSGEKPLSKWSKSVIIEEIENDIDGVNINELRRLTKDELVNSFLKYSSWHHTGSLYNITSFYSINRDADFSKDNIDRIISERKVSKKPKADKKRDVEVGAISDDIYNKLNIIYNSGSTGLKTIAGVFSRWKNTNDIDTMYNEALEKIRTLDANKVEGWRNLPEDHWRREYVDLYDNNIETYANKVYSQTINRKSKLYKDIKTDIDSRYSGDETEFKYSIDSEGRELTQQQEEYFQDSKVRDENGQLLVVYHGTDAEFDVFKNTGSGHYFTANPKYAERYGSNVRAFYLNIVKPFDITQDSVRDDFVQFVRDGYSNSLHPTTSIADIYKAIENGIDWTEADNLIEWIEENELDYDGLIIDEGGDLDENGEVFDRGNSYVSFNSNQAKLTSNENPTENESVKFSMDAPYEETRDLVAVHNVKESDIAGLLKLQGIPMPSIAVIKAAQGHDMYGEYSFIFGKDTIDPAKNKANKVYGGDAWTPVFPTVEYEVKDDKAFDAFRKRIADLTAGARQEVRDTLYGLDYTDMFNDKLRSNNGLEKFKEALLDDTRMMQVFLDTKGQYVDTIVKKEEDTMSPAEVEKHKFIIDKLGEDVVRASVPDKSSGVKIGDYRREYLEKNGEAIKEAYKAYGMEIIGLPEDVVDQTIEGMNRFELFKIPRTALQYLDEGPTKVKETPDYRGTEDAIREKTDEAEYKKWLDDLFGGLTIQEGLYNGKDYYTPSGDRRSFKDTHMDATLNNIVKAMKLHENGETMLGHSFKAVAQKKYDSIADIKADSKRLEKMSEEEYSEKNKEFADRESKIIDRFFDDVKIGAYDNPFIIRDTINTILVDSIRNAKSSADVLSELKEYPYTKNATKADADAIWQLVEDVANMPTGYFEAKPERAVTFDEVQAVIAPDNAPSEIIDGLKEQNVDVVTYEAGNEEDRKEKLNSLDNVKFSLDAEENKVEDVQLTWDMFMDSEDAEQNFDIAQEAISDLQEFERKNNGNSLIRTVGKAISTELVREGFVNFMGRKVSDARDVAEMCQVLRDPRFETSRIIMVKGDKVVSVTSVTSKLPGVSAIFKQGMSFRDGIADVADRMRRCGADGYYMVHNHPSGNVKASTADISSTAAFIEYLPGFKGHIILDHNKFGLIEYSSYSEKRTKASEVKMTGQQTIDFLHMPELDHELLGTEIRSTMDVGEMAKAVQMTDKVSVVVYTNTHLEVVGVQEIDNKAFNNKQMVGYFKNRLVDFGAHKLFVFTKNGDVYESARDLARYAICQDAIYQDENGFCMYGMLDGFKAKRNYEAGVNTKDIRSYFREDTPSQDEIVKYSMSKSDDFTSFAEDCLEGDTSDEAQARRQKARDEVEAALADIVRKDTQLTYGKTLNRKSVKKPIKDLVFGLMESSENTHRDKIDMVDFVMDSADAIWHKFHNKDTDLSDLMLIVSREVVENIKFVDDEMYQAYQDLRRYLRNNKISVPEFLKEDISWADYRKKNFGRMRLVSGTAHSIDGKWEEIVPLIQPFVNEKNYGNGYGLLEVENEAEMFFALDEALDNTKAYRDAYADAFAQDIELQFAKDLAAITLKQGEAWESFADKKKEYYETRAKEMQARHKVAMRELREQRDKKLAEAEQKRKDDLAKQKQKYEQREEKRKAEEREKKEKQKAKKQDHRARMKAFGHIEKNYNWLTKRLLDPMKEDDQHIPEGFINSLASVLSAFDLQTERSKSLEERTGKVSKPTEALRKMREELQELSKEDESGIFVYNGALFSIMDNLIKSLDGHPLRDLNTEDLTNIDDMLASIKHMIQNENRLFADAKKQAASSAGDAVIKESKEKIARYGRRYERKGLVGELDHILNEDMMTPMNFFKSLGTQMKGLYKHLRYGQDDYIRKVDELRRIFDDMFKPYRKKGFLGHARSGSVIEEWQNDKSAQTFKVASGEEVTMSVAQMMSLYCLSKREQAMQHILGNGVVLSDVKMTKLMDKVTGKVERSALSVRLTYDDVIKIIDSLTQEQKELAQKMQELMNGKLQEWGNETSMQLYGIRLFKEKNYFPIESSDWYLPGEIGKASGIKGNKITSFGFTKPLTEGANNPIVIGDIFDIVTDHANKMALYSAYAAPLIDFNRVMNYVKHDEETGLTEGSVEQALHDAYGPRAIEFIDNLLDDINGQANTRMDGIKELINKSLSNYKSAAIGFNLRVLVQQPTAILRATYYINPKYFINPSEANLKKNVREMHEHCPIAAWKAWGNYQNDFSRGLQDIITNNSNNMWETMTMGIYGFADDMTWGMIWGAVKNEIKAKHPNVEYGSEEFWVLCNERASLVFDETQVVDSVFHRSDAMRNKDTATKMVTSFMSEPTRTYNMIRSSIVMSYRMVKDGDTVGATKEMTKAITVFIANAAAVSAAAAVVDALRGKGGDDDDDWYELWMANFLRNLQDNGNPLNNIVWVKDVSGMIVKKMRGEYIFGTSNMVFEGWYKFAKGLPEITDVLSGEMSIFEFLEGDLCAGLGYITGIPTFNMLREVKTLWTKLGLPVFADDGTVESSSGTGESVLTEGIFSKLGIGPSEAERYAKHIDKLTKKYSGKSDENMLEMATDGYRKLVDNRDFSELSARREAIRRAGGDVDAFDEKIHSYVGTSYKKTIGDSSSQEDFDSQQAMKDWMLSNGWTEQQISDVVYRSDTAREFKAACRMLDHDAAVKALTPLLEAGLTEQDIYKLWNNRNRGNYDTSSTGTYVWGTEGTITSGFGNRGYVTPGASSYHQGIDIGAEMGTKVVAADGGVVTFAGNDGSGYGNYIIVTHDNGTQTYYGHLSGIGVRKGQRVSQSQPIGNVGSTGISTGPHLHFAMKINGSFVDPSKYIKK